MSELWKTLRRTELNEFGTIYDNLINIFIYILCICFVIIYEHTNIAA